MSDDLLITYIKEMLAVGHSPDSVKEGVKEKGGDPDLVDQVINNKIEVLNKVETLIKEAEHDKDSILDYIHRNQSLAKGSSYGIMFGLVGAALWAFIAIATDRMIGYLACAVGYGVGWAVRKFGKGVGNSYRVSAVCITAASLFLANSIVVMILFSKHLGIPISDAIKVLLIKEFYIFMIEIHDIFLIVCYLAAILCAWWISVIKLTPEVMVEYALIIKSEKRS